MPVVATGRRYISTLQISISLLSSPWVETLKNVTLQFRHTTRLPSHSVSENSSTKAVWMNWGALASVSLLESPGWIKLFLAMLRESMPLIGCEAHSGQFSFICVAIQWESKRKSVEAVGDLINPRQTLSLAQLCQCSGVALADWIQIRAESVSEASDHLGSETTPRRPQDVCSS